MYILTIFLLLKSSKIYSSINPYFLLFLFHYFHLFYSIYIISSFLSIISLFSQFPFHFQFVAGVTLLNLSFNLHFYSKNSSFIPLMPFTLLNIYYMFILSIILSIISLFYLLFILFILFILYLLSQYPFDIIIFLNFHSISNF